MSRPMIRSELRAEVYRLLAESAGFYTDAGINQWLFDGVDEIAIKLEPIFADARMSVVANTNEYVLPDDLISIKKVLYKKSTDTNWAELIETTYERLFEENAGWESSTATSPSLYYWRQDTLGLYPNPTTAQTAPSYGVRIIYTCRPAEMADDTSITGLPDYTDRAVVRYAVMQARATDRDEKRKLATKAEYEEALAFAATLIDKQRKQHGPRLTPLSRSYRTYYYNRFPKTQMTTA